MCSSSSNLDDFGTVISGALAKKLLVSRGTTIITTRIVSSAHARKEQITKSRRIVLYDQQDVCPRGVEAKSLASPGGRAGAVCPLGEDTMYPQGSREGPLCHGGFLVTQGGRCRVSFPGEESSLRSRGGERRGVNASEGKIPFFSPGVFYWVTGG